MMCEVCGCTNPGLVCYDADGVARCMTHLTGIDPFKLSNPAPRPAPACFDNDPARQTKLLSGLSCLEGQQDLFPDLDKQE
jgi:hypothetical protein